MVRNSEAWPRTSDMPLELHKIISRMSRDAGNPDEMSTLGEAAARIVLLEQAVRNLLRLMEDTSYPELQASIRSAQTLVDGAQV